jgi:hypothetical protein
MNRIRCIGGSLVVLLLVALPAHSQQLVPVGATERGAAAPRLADTAASVRRDSLAAPVPHRAAEAARGAVVGAVIGTAAGVATAIVLTNSPSVSDHSEDGFAYLFLGCVGAVAGVLVGAVVGAIR